MKLFRLLFLLALAVPVSAQTAPGNLRPPDNATRMLNAVTADGSPAVPLNTRIYGAIKATITISGTATVNFEGRIDTSQAFSARKAVKESDTANTIITSTATSGDYIVYLAGDEEFNPRVSGCSACTVTVWVRQIPSVGKAIYGDGGGSGAPVDATFITETSNGTLTNEFPMSALATGIVKNTTGTGVPSIAAAGTDYQAPLANSAGLRAALSDELGTGAALFDGATPAGFVLTNATGLPLTTGVTGVLPGANGGTGVANTGFSITLGGNLVTSGAFATTLTVTGITGVTLPTTGTLATLAGSEELTNKTLNASVGKGTWTASGTWTLPAHTLGGTVSGGGNQINNVIIGTSTPLAGSFTSLTASGNVTAQASSGNGFLFASPAPANSGLSAPAGAYMSLYWNGFQSASMVGGGMTLNNGPLGFNTSTGAAFDLSISRNAAGIAQFGTTAANALGSWLATNGTLSGSLTTNTITGAAANMTITSGTGNSRTMALQTTTSGGVATTFLTGNADQSATFAGDALPASTQNLGSAALPWASQYLGSTTQYVSTIITANTITYAAAGSATNIDMVFTPKGGGQVLTNKSIAVTGSLTVSGNINFPNTGNIQSTSRAILNTPTDGVWLMTNAAANDFTSIKLGGTTSSFPALGRSTTRLTVGLADGTAGGGINFSTASVISIASGTNQRAGNLTLVGGTSTVSNTTVTANSIVILTRKTSGGTIGTAVTYSVSAGTSFTVQSDNVLDTSTFSFLLLEVP